MTGDRGQALPLTVLAIAVGATAVMGLRLAQDRLLIALRADRAGEAAVQAAGTIVADAQLASVHGRDATATFSLASTVRDDALRVAARLSAENGGGPTGPLDVRDRGARLEVSLAVAGRSHRVTVDKVPCCLR